MAAHDSFALLMNISLVAVFCSLSFARQQSAQQATPTANAAQGAQSVAASTTSQAVSAEQVQKGQSLFATQCAFCHGRDAAGGETGPDLTSSELVEKDVNGNEIAPVVRSGRIDKGMPPFNLSDTELAAVVAFIHDQKIKMESHAGRRRSVQPEDLQTGNAEEGKQYFNGAGGCAKCHSASGDLAGVANRFRGLALLERMLYPSGRRAGPSSSPATVTVSLPSGETVTGKFAYRDEFVIGLVDSSGWYRSWFKSNVKFKVNDPLEAHSEQLGKYTEEDMHNVLAYLQTLR
jgi:cytochrome c oxidase cbb3-type subunit III